MTRPQTFNGVQALRLVAALLVVASHAAAIALERLQGLPPGHFWRAGFCGVDIFFVISGFVMTLTSTSLENRADGWSEFLKRRVIRVVPMYWIALSLQVLMVAGLHGQGDPTNIVASYFFLPSRDANGFLTPILSVGWTLQYEMFFYALFAAALFLKRPPVLLCGVVFTVLAALGLAFYTPHAGMSPLLAYIRPILLEFIYGMLIARFMSQRRLHPALAAALLLGGVALIFSMPLIDAWRPFAWGLPAAMIVLGVVQLEFSVGKWVPRWVREQGDASYALYLFHSFMLPALAWVFLRAHVHNVPLMLAAALVAGPLMALVIHRVIEKPLTQRLKQLRLRPLLRPA